MEGTISEIRGFAGTFAPRNWMYCDGQILSISEYSSLYSLLGANFGGNGTSTFGLPDLRGRVLIHKGSRPGGETRIFGETGGIERVSLHVNEMPVHNHSTTSQGGTASLSGKATAKMFVNNDESGENAPDSAFLGVSSKGLYASEKGEEDNTLNEGAITVDTSKMNVELQGLQVGISNAGGGNSHYNLQPFQVISYIICINGIYPQRWD